MLASPFIHFRFFAGSLPVSEREALLALFDREC